MCHHLRVARVATGRVPHGRRTAYSRPAFCAHALRSGGYRTERGESADHVEVTVEVTGRRLTSAGFVKRQQPGLSAVECAGTSSPHSDRELFMSYALARVDVRR